MSTSYRFLHVCFLLFSTEYALALWLWLWKPPQAIVTAVSAELLQYLSWLLAGLLDSGRFRFGCQDSLCSVGSLSAEVTMSDGTFFLRVVGVHQSPRIGFWAALFDRVELSDDSSNPSQLWSILLV